MSWWSISTLRLQITKTERGQDRASGPWFSWVIYLFMETLYSLSKWADTIAEAQWVPPLSLQTQTIPGLLALNKTGQTSTMHRWGELRTGRPQAGRRMLPLKKVPANMWILFPRPLISSDHAGLRLGGSAEQMPGLLLGCQPWRHFGMSKTQTRQYYILELFPLKSLQSRLDTDRNLIESCQGTKTHGSTGPLDKLAKPNFVSCLMFLLKKCLLLRQYYILWQP